MTWLDCKQRAMKVVFDSPGLVDFAIGVVDSVLKLPDRQANYRRTVLNPAHQKILSRYLKFLLGYYMVATACPNSLASVGRSKIRVTFPQVRVQVTMIQVNE